MKIHGAHQFNNQFDRASQYGDAVTLDKTLKHRGDQTQYVPPQAVQPTEHYEQLISQRSLNHLVGLEQTSHQEFTPLNNQQLLQRERGIEQAQVQLTNQADALAQTAQQFQDFLTGGSPFAARTHWAQMHRGGNMAQQLLRSNIPLKFRG